MNFTPLARALFRRRVSESLSWRGRTQEVQLAQLDYLLRNLRKTRWAADTGLSEVRSYEDFRRLLPATVPYASLRPYVMRMIEGERDVLWPGRTRNFAQSSGTSDGKSKYIPVTADSFSRCHYRGGADVVAHYLSLYPDSRLFSGKSFILGGSFANELSLICAKAGINVWELIELANKHPRVHILQPGSGVGGHCIAVDPYFITADFPSESQLIAKSREINNYKAFWCAGQSRYPAVQSDAGASPAGSPDGTVFQAEYRRPARESCQVYRFESDGGGGCRLPDRRAERARASGL